MRFISILLLFPLLLSCNNGQSTSDPSASPISPKDIDENFDPEKVDTATFAGGCFWCVEASFQQIKGIKAAISGYAGGNEKDPSYKEVANGFTNHAETVQVYYDPEVIDYETLLEIFFTAHDPTQLNRQGPDIGPQYRSAIFYHNEKQKKLAIEKIEELQGTKFDDEIVTELNPYTEFWIAENYHQNYKIKNPNDRYIQQVSLPKINKVKKQFSDRLKEEYR